MFADGKPSINKVSYTSDLLTDVQEKGNLQLLDLSDWKEVEGILKEKTDKQLDLIGHYIHAKKYRSLNNLMFEWGMPRKSSDEQLKILKSNGIQTFRSARELGIRT